MPFAYTPTVLHQGDYVQMGDNHFVVVQEGAAWRLLPMAPPSLVCDRVPKPGDALGEVCQCGHTTLVHDRDGCGMCALRQVIKEHS